MHLMCVLCVYCVYHVTHWKEGCHVQPDGCTLFPNLRFYVLLFGQKCHINLMHSMHVALDIVRNLLGAQLSFITSLMDVNSVTQYTPQPEEVNNSSCVFLRNVKKSPSTRMRLSSHLQCTPNWPQRKGQHNKELGTWLHLRFLPWEAVD